jgi:hypothetical protein
MPSLEESVRTLAEMVHDSLAMNEASRAGDFDEARFRAVLVASKAEAGGFTAVAQAADDLIVLLGPAGSKPNADQDAAMVWVASALEESVSRMRTMGKSGRL